MLWRARYCRRFANHQITKNREIPDLVRTLDQGTDPESRNREKVTCLGRAPDSQIRGPDPESRNREIAKSRNREIAKKSHVMTGLRTPRSGVRITNREIAKSRNREKILVQSEHLIGGPYPGSQNREIAKSLMNYQGRWFLNQGSH